MIELLAPAGSMDKLEIALNFGADAVYFSGKKFGLRAFADNFSEEEILAAVKMCHKVNKKAYVTVNIIAKDSDFMGLEEYLKFLQHAGIDGVIAADIGIIQFIREKTPALDIHVSTQANITNLYAARFFADMKVKRIVLARELSIDEIKEIRTKLDSAVELECFVHGAMCISYSGRCLLSNYFTGRESNRGACVQACRWEYAISEKSRDGNYYPIEEDEHGTYILNSKDLNMLEYIDKLANAGVTAFKIEGRMKSVYYVATVVNAYRRALDKYLKNPYAYKANKILIDELFKASHRNYTTGFYFGEKNKECTHSSLPVQTAEFMAIVLEDHKNGRALIEMRNRFKVGDILEVLSPTNTFNKKIKIERLENMEGEEVINAKNVQEKLYLYTKLPLKRLDILRSKVNLLFCETKK